MASNPAPIAIVGIGCRFPGGASSPEKLWEVLSEGQETWSEVPEDRFNWKSFHHPDPENGGTHNHRGGHFLDSDIATFDGKFFGISPQECEAIDPQYRLQLEVTYEALENAGLSLENLRGSDTAVYVATFGNDYAGIQYRDLDTVSKYHLTGTGSTMASNQISYLLDLRGPSITLDTGCSGSIVAIHQACQSLRTGEAKIAVAGGVSLIITPDLMIPMSMIGVLNKDGKCYSFDSRGAGYGRGEGAAMVVLKKLDDAIRDGDNIRGIIRNSGLGQDGKTPGITVPSREAQLSLIQSVYRQANLDPKHTRYIEAHGTGTIVGDGAEIAAIRAAFGGDDESPINVGSIKPNIGHLESASGIASLIKAVLMLENDAIPPNVNLVTLKENLQGSDIAIPTRLKSWDENTLRRISVNNYGYGGTNGHLILDSLSTYENEVFERQKLNHDQILNGLHNGEQCRMSGHTKTNSDDFVLVNGHDHEYTNEEPSDNTSNSQKEHYITNGVAKPIGNAKSGVLQQPDHASTYPQVLVMTAKSEESLIKNIDNLWQWVSQNSNPGDDAFRDLAYTLSTRRSLFRWRYSLVGTSFKDITARLSSNNPKPTKSGNQRQNVFVFTGQGAQWFAMGRELMGPSTLYLRSLQASDRILKEFGASWSLMEELSKEASTSRVNESEIAQPTTTALQIALVDLLSSIKILPDAVIGHSSGEIAAAYAAGSLSQHSALKAAYYRGLLRVSGSLKGAMMAVGLGEKSVSQYISQVTSGKVVVACSNSPESSTVSGDEVAILELKKILDAESIFARRLAVDTAYHSHHVRSVAEQYLYSLEGLEYNTTSSAVRFISSVTGTEMTSGFGADYWVNNLVSPVHFQNGLEELCRKMSLASPQSKLTFIELGPHNALSGPIKQTIASLKLSSGYFSTSILARNQDARYTLLEAAGKLFEEGCPVDLQTANLLFESNQRQKVLIDLPTYSWDHSTKYWRESRLSKAHRFRKHPYHDLLGSRVASSTGLNPVWRHMIGVDNLPWLGEHVIDGSMIFPGSGYISMAIEAMRQLISERHDPLSISSYNFKNIQIPAALVIPYSPTTVEIQLSFVTGRNQQENSKSKWEEFKVFSVSAQGASVEHCHGFIMAEMSSDTDEVETTREKNLDSLSEIRRLNELESVCDDELDCVELYRDLKSRGNSYGPNFSCIKELTLGSTHALGVLNIPDMSQSMPVPFQQPHVIHPATLDALMHQAVAIFNRHTQDTVFMIVGIDELKISSRLASEPGTSLTLATTTAGIGSRFPLANISAFQKNSDLDMEVVIQMKAAKIRATGGANSNAPDGTQERNMSYTMNWDLDADHMTSSMFLPGPDAFEADRAQERKLDFLNQAAAIYVSRCVKSLTANGPPKLSGHFPHLFKWMKRWQESEEFKSLLQDVFETNVEQILQDAQKLGVEGELLWRVGRELDSILIGKSDALSLMLENDLLYRLYADDASSRCYAHVISYMKKLVFKNPNMKVIELGGGTGGTTAPLLGALDLNGILPFEKYVFTDVSSGFFERTRARLQKWDSYLEYKKLDLNIDISEQGFEEEGYDLIIAANCLHVASSMDVVMSSVRNLLKPGGKIVMIEMTRTVPLYNTFVGLLDGWWAGIEDGRVDSPGLSVEQWHPTLLRNSFSGVEIVANDFEGKAQRSAVLVSRAADRINNLSVRPSVPIKLIFCPSWSVHPPQFAIDLSSGLIKHGFNVTMENLFTTQFSAEHIYIILDDGLDPILTTDTPTVFGHVKSLLEKATRVLWVSSQDNPTANMNPEKGMIAGLARVVRAENELLRLITMDVQDSIFKSFGGLIQAIIKIVKSGLNDSSGSAKELEYIYRNQEVLIPRLLQNENINERIQNVSGKVKLQTQPFHQPNRPLKLHVQKPGFLDSLSFVDDKALEGSLSASHIEVRVEACGLNFKDVLIALGQISKDYSMTAEFAGVVTKVGSDHQSLFQVGDRVCGMGGSPYASTVRLDGQRASHFPLSMSFEVAASIPVVFATAYHGLVDIANLQMNQTVLIHSAAGGVGQAALRIAQHIGAEIFVTVGNAAKRELLIKQFGIPEDHIFSSKLRTFRQGIYRITKGKGVDVILNSLSADALSNAGLSMAPFERNVTFASIDLQMIADYRPQKIRSILQAVLSLFEDGAYLPINPITTMSITNIEDAFRLLQTRKHTGKVILKADSEATVKAPAVAANDLIISEEGVCLIAGGLGGLGLEIARMLGRNGTKSIALMSRRHLTSSELGHLEEEFKLLGTKLYILTCDITELSKLRESISPFGVDMPPIKSVIQASTILQDRVLSKMSLEDFKLATQPKCLGTSNLVEVFNDQPLDFFLMLSSTAGMLGMISQANYAAGNNYMDTLAQNKRIAKDATTNFVSIDFGPIDDAGIIADRTRAKEGMLRRGFVLIKLKEILALISYAISHSAKREKSNQFVLGFDYKSITESDNTDTLQNPMFSHLLRHSSRQSFKEDKSPVKSIQTLIAAAKDTSKINLMIAEEIARKMSNLVAMDFEEIELERRMADFGLDSLVIIEMKNWITQTFQAKLQASEISDVSNIMNLAGIVASRSALITKNLPSQPPESDDSRTAPEQKEPEIVEQKEVKEIITLPKQPLPDLDNSLSQFLDSLLPVLTSEEYARYKNYVTEFLKPEGFGQKLQARLSKVAQDPQVENWLSEFYATSMFLKGRRPLVPWLNFFATHFMSPVPHAAAERAAIISNAAFRFKRELERCEVGYGYYNEQPISKDAYQWFFNATREPGNPKDFMRRYPGNDYMIAFRRGHAYKISVPDLDEVTSYSALRDAFQNILDADQKSESWVGVLTQDTRDRWADLRTELQALSKENETWIHDIEASAFVLYLDDVQPQNASERGPHFLHANGFNRWSDKTIQFSICDNGISATIGEHTMLDGVTFLRLNDFVTKAIMTFNPQDPTNIPSHPAPVITVSEPYTFKTTPVIEEHITRIRAQLKKDTSRVEFRAFEIPTLNRELFRLHKCPPNSGFQLAIQLAVRRYFGHNPAAFEPISLNHFHKGRIDVNHIMRPSISNFCAAAADTKMPADELRGLFLDAARIHASNVITTSRGHGFDRHLFALEWSIREGETVPALFTDPTYKCKRRPPQIMTNCIVGEALEGGDFFDHPNGVSVTYETKDAFTKISIWGPVGQVDKLIEVLEESCRDIRAIIEFEP
ncbi:hypothetical protein OCU04_010391 [Sclerotinia nivalis]|uniref:Carrier domain-containing protein n=1 Tax=Sclerotinia nivalis TaxID=352851 RepID=A0A9X0AFL9_9HELO|nr:hypothetical protein OCU04_010391 [Sclerotinia nivalis]